VTVDRQTQALLDLVEADRAQRCGALLAAAQARADAIVRQAYGDARARMHAAFREERERHDTRVRAAQANLQTRRRHALQRRATALLDAAWLRLPEELVRRWHDEAARKAWVAAVVENARSLLPSCAWRIVHAPDWPSADRENLAAELAAGLPAELPAELAAAQSARLAFEASEAIRAGLKISGNGNVVDGTLEGILADRAEIGGRLLQILET
jgi:hypothetical protein